MVAEYNITAQLLDICCQHRSVFPHRISRLILDKCLLFVLIFMFSCEAVYSLMHDAFHHCCPAYLQNLVMFTESHSAGAGSDHLPPGLLSQSGRGRSLEVALCPSMGRLCGTVYHLNFDSSTVVEHFADD